MRNTKTARIIFAVAASLLALVTTLSPVALTHAHADTAQETTYTLAQTITPAPQNLKGEVTYTVTANDAESIQPRPLATTQSLQDGVLTVKMSGQQDETNIVFPLTKAGTFSYTIRATASTIDGVQLDKNVYTLTLYVTAKANGFSSAITVTGNPAEDKKEQVQFKHTYTPPAPINPSAPQPSGSEQNLGQQLINTGAAITSIVVVFIVLTACGALLLLLAKRRKHKDEE